MPTYNEALEQYLRQTFAVEDETLEHVRRQIKERGLPEIMIRPEEARFLQTLVAASGARKVLEIGTLGGYSGIWIARVLPEGGRLITLEVSAKHAAVAREHFALAGVDGRVEVREGDAHTLLPGLADEGPFDFVFIDAEKEGYPAYLDWALENVRAGGVIAAHNAFSTGRVVDSANHEPNVETLRQFNLRLASDPRLISCVFPGGDGMAVAVLHA